MRKKYIYNGEVKIAIAFILKAFEYNGTEAFLKITSHYYPTVLVIAQKARETSTHIPGYCTVGYCTVLCARSSCYTCSFLSSY